MFAPGDFGPPDRPTPNTSSQRQARLIGLAVLIAVLFIILIASITLDAAVIVPYEATHALTLTSRAVHPATTIPLRPTFSNPGRPNRTPVTDYQSAENVQNSSLSANPELAATATPTPKFVVQR